MKPKEHTCRKCGKSHHPNQCPAYQVSCHRCGKMNHYAKICESSKMPHKRTVHNFSPEINSLFILTVDLRYLNSKTGNAWRDTTHAGYVSVKVMLDIGAEADILLRLKFKAPQRSERKWKEIELAIITNIHCVNCLWKSHADAKSDHFF